MGFCLSPAPDQVDKLARRSANRGAPKAVKETKGLLNQAVTKALEPSFFFAMFEQDVDDFVGKTPNPNVASSTHASGRCGFWLGTNWKEDQASPLPVCLGHLEQCSRPDLRPLLW